MHKQSGNFLLQALLALTVMFAFIPMVVGRISSRDLDAKMYATTNQIEIFQTVARIYVRENADGLSYGQTILSGNALIDALEPYGLPIGFRSRTALDQDVRVIVDKSPTDIIAGIEIIGGKTSELDNAELARRIGFYATTIDNGVYVGVVLSDSYSDVVRRNETNLTNSRFLNDLDMGDNSLSGAVSVSGHNGVFETGQFDNISISGIETDRKIKNTIKTIITDKTVFQSRTGETALTLTRGTLSAKNVTTRTIAEYGDTGNLTARVAGVYDFSMTAGRTGFTGPLDWSVHGSLISDRINFSVERLDISSYLNAASGQDVYIDSSSSELTYSSNSGIDTGTIFASNITLRDQTSGGINLGASGGIIVDVRPAGTSVLPDVYIESINNDDIEILADPAGADAQTETCKSIISDLGKTYNSHSLAQKIICEYVFWQRLEKRIDIKQCMLSGGNGCM
ncbi:MAG: hypothetical protein KBS86_01700 [Proteobacteria bacterium]|nr:hypothetical protein [Candidatus Enterousia scatequi]